MAFTFRLSTAQWLQAAALILALAGVLLWSSLLLTPAESNAPLLEPAAAVRSDSPASQWFSNQPAAVDIKVSGIMTGAQGAVAILSLNDGPPGSFLVGERLVPGVRLAAIESQAVVIERGTQQTRLEISPLPETPLLPRLTRP